MSRATSWKDLLRPGDAASFFDREPLPAFDAGLASYSAANAWWLAELSRLVYRHDVEEDPAPLRPTRASFLERAGLRQLAFFNAARTGSEAFLVQTIGAPRWAALVFRGTEQDVRDFRSDLETFPIRVGGDGARVHEGFEEGLSAVWRMILPELEKLDCPVFYAGHSLGAALATLAAARRRPQAAYVFGSPRVGNEQFAAALRSVPLYRIVDDTDAVSELPPEWMGFRHAGELHRIGPRPGPSRRFDLLAWVRSIAGPPRRLADHAPINYVRRLCE